jgi:mutator protein MutT
MERAEKHISAVGIGLNTNPADTSVRRLGRQILLGVGVVKDRRGRLLLTRRHEPGIAELHNRWELPGGKVRFGEDPAAAVIREVAEETGVTVSTKRMLPHVISIVRRTPEGRIHVLILCYICKLLRVPVDAHCPPKKVSAVLWAPRADLNNLDLQDGTRIFCGLTEEC